MHEFQFGSKCHVRDCSRDKMSGTQACSHHQSEWQQFFNSHTQRNLAGFHRMIRQPGENQSWEPNTTRQAQPETLQQLSRNYFTPARFYCVETICAPCGVVIAWAKFAKSESPTNIIHFLETVYPSEDSCPDYICIDKACLVLCTAINNGSWEFWKKTSRFIVDSYHYIGHRVEDYLCRKWCNPAPLDGSAPNLVVVAETNGQRYYKRAFNTQACEQLNAWLGGFESVLKKMTVSNFDWFLHTMLYFHTRTVLQRKESDEVDDSDSDESEVEEVNNSD